MEAPGPAKLHLVGKSSSRKRHQAGSRWLGKKFASGKRIPESGIFRVSHAEHRLPHEVTLLKGESFPVCLKCDRKVEFELVRPVPDIQEVTGFLVKLHALPEVERRSWPREEKSKAA
jgi:hypothetical protein